MANYNVTTTYTTLANIMGASYDATKDDVFMEKQLDDKNHIAKYKGGCFYETENRLCNKFQQQ